MATNVTAINLFKKNKNRRSNTNKMLFMTFSNMRSIMVLLVLCKEDLKIIKPNINSIFLKYVRCVMLTHSLLRLVKPTFPIELNRKQKHFQRNAIWRASEASETLSGLFN